MAPTRNSARKRTTRKKPNREKSARARADRQRARNVVTPKSWEALQVELFADSWQEELRRHRSSWAFRGVSSSTYDLSSTLQRLGHQGAKQDLIEESLRRSFKKYAHGENVDGEWQWLSVAQHHGLPTRIIDWSYSPYVALHFATSELDKMSEAGAVYCMNIDRAHASLPSRLAEMLSDERCHVFTIEMLERKFMDTKEWSAKEGEREFALFFEPPSLDSRIVNQNALFSMMSDASLLADEWAGDDPALIKKVILPAKLKWEVRDKLDQANITERVLFPGLDGLSTWLKRWYTPRPPSQ